MGMAASLNRLPNVTNLYKRNFIYTNLCTLCGSESESLIHIFYSCPFAKEVRHLLKISLIISDNRHKFIACMGSYSSLERQTHILGRNCYLMETLASKKQLLVLFNPVHSPWYCLRYWNFCSCRIYYKVHTHTQALFSSFKKFLLKPVILKIMDMQLFKFLLIVFIKTI